MSFKIQMYSAKREILWIKEVAHVDITPNQSLLFLSECRKESDIIRLDMKIMSINVDLEKITVFYYYGLNMVITKLC